MKRSRVRSMAGVIGLIVVVFTMTFAAPVSGQPGFIGVYEDPTGTDCTAADAPNGFLAVYVIHQLTPGVTAAQFGLEASNPTGFLHLGETSPFPTTIGSVWLHDDGNGGVVAYGSCASAPILAKTVNFLTMGTNPECTTLSIVPDPASLTGTIEVVDCANNKLIGDGSYMLVPPGGACPNCFGDPPFGPVLSVTPSSLDFGASTDQLTLTMSNVGLQTLYWNIVESVPWLSVSPLSGTDLGVVTVTVDRTGLTSGSYNGVISVQSNGGDIDVPVDMSVVEPIPVLSVTPTSKTLAYNENSFHLGVSNIGSGTLNWNIVSNESWLSAAPDNGTGDATVSVSVDRTGLPDGVYAGTLDVTSNGGNATVTVFMSVLTMPLLQVSPTTLTFVNTSQTKTFDISNGGPGTLTWSVTPNEPWVQVAPENGSGTAEITVTLDAGSISASSGQIQVTSNGGNATVQVNVLGVSPGFLGVFTEPLGGDCTVNDVPGGLFTVYIVHMDAPGVSAVEAALETDNPSNFVFLGESSPFPTIIGTFWIHDDGLGGTTAYGGCYASPITVKQVTLLTVVNNPTCTSLCIVPDPGAPTGTIEVVDCNNNKLVGNGACMYINPDGSCTCGAPTAVESKTWGAVKSQFMDWNTPEFKARQKR